jgi:XTP/dITP diphosphohydrolase
MVEEHYDTGMAERLLLATTNAGKVREIRALLEGLPYELIGLDALPTVQAPEETGSTFAENARLKAEYYSRTTGLTAVAEDSGLEVDALGGAPGVESARYGGADAPYDEKFRLIYKELDRAGVETSAARFVCALALAEHGVVRFESRGVVEGVIARQPSGAGGFGYDPIFFYPPYGATLADVDPARKSAVSHRGHAFRALRQHLAARP